MRCTPNNTVHFHPLRYLDRTTGLGTKFGTEPDSGRLYSARSGWKCPV